MNNLYWLLTAPLVWVIIATMGLKSGYPEETLARDSIWLTVIIYLAILGIVLATR